MTTTAVSLRWSAEQSDVLIDEYGWMCANTDYYARVPDVALDLMWIEAERLGYPDHEGLLNVATMVHDDALLLAILEHWRVVGPQQPHG